MTKRLVLLTAAGLLLGGLVVLCSRSPADTPRSARGAEGKRATPAGAIQGQPAAPASEDPAFDKYVDFALLGRAWLQLDAAALTDVALQFAEGERVLLRPHKTFSSGQILDLAMQVATEKGDTATLDRIARAAERSEDKARAAKAADAKSKNDGKARAIAGVPPVSVPDTTVANFARYKAVVQSVERARITGNVDAITRLEKIQFRGLSDKQREAVRKLTADARSQMPKEPDRGLRDTVRALERAHLAGGERSRALDQAFYVQVGSVNIRIEDNDGNAIGTAYVGAVLTVVDIWNSNSGAQWYLVTWEAAGEGTVGITDVDYTSGWVNSYYTSPL